MEMMVLDWMGPFKIKEAIPSDLKGCPGLYLIEYASEILYVGKAETEGALHRAKDHFRGQGDSTGRWILEARNDAQIQIWVSTTEKSDLIRDAEELLILKLKPRANVNYVDKYGGKPLHVINKGNYPQELPREIRYST